MDYLKKLFQNEYSWVIARPVCCSFAHHIIRDHTSTIESHEDAMASSPKML